MACGIYTITNTVNGKVYVGQSGDVEAREKHHFGQLKLGKHFNCSLQDSVNKHGLDNFEFKVVQIVSPAQFYPDFSKDFMEYDPADPMDETQRAEMLDELWYLEKLWIVKFDSYKNGYNQTPGERTTLGIKLSGATRERISAALKRRKDEFPPEWHAAVRAKIKATIELRSPERANRLLAELEKERSSLTPRQINTRLGRIYGPERAHEMRLEKLLADVEKHGVTDALKEEHRQLCGNYSFYASPSGKRFRISLKPVPDLPGYPSNRKGKANG